MLFDRSLCFGGLQMQSFETNFKVYIFENYTVIVSV